MNLNILGLKKGFKLSFYFDSEKKISLLFLLKLKKSNFETLSVILKPKIVNQELLFDVIKYNNNILCNNFIELSYINEKSKNYLKKFKKNYKLKKL